MFLLRSHRTTRAHIPRQSFPVNLVPVPQNPRFLLGSELAGRERTVVPLDGEGVDVGEVPFKLGGVEEGFGAECARVVLL